MNLLKKIKLARKTFLTKYQRSYYSQFGEDAILRELVGRKKQGFYVDVGCYHPKRFSNTYMLHRRGWFGINIDMEEDKVFCFKLARPNDHNIVAAVSNSNEQVTIFRDRPFSLGTTINPVIGERICGGVGAETILTKTLDEIIIASPFKDLIIDVLSIDCEGHDFSVLMSLDIDRFKPGILIIEDQLMDIELILVGETYQYLRSKGYILRSWTHLSLIFVRSGSVQDDS
jgi:hypothetical protein